MRVHLRTVILAAVALGPVASLAAIIGRDNAASNAYLATDGNGANDTDPTNNTNGWVSGDAWFCDRRSGFSTVDTHQFRSVIGLWSRRICPVQVPHPQTD